MLNEPFVTVLPSVHKEEQCGKQRPITHWVLWAGTSCTMWPVTITNITSSILQSSFGRDDSGSAGKTILGTNIAVFTVPAAVLYPVDWQPVLQDTS
jgi:hypothetical protein